MMAFNKAVTNPAMMRLAGSKNCGASVVHHRGAMGQAPMPPSVIGTVESAWKSPIRLPSESRK